MKFTTHFELHSQTTRLVEGASHGKDSQSHTGLSPSMTLCSKKLRLISNPKHPLQITIRTPEKPDFKFELLPLHSPLLRQSLLVSFPPLIDMLKFSGYPYLIRGQTIETGGLSPRDAPAKRPNSRDLGAPKSKKSYYAEAFCKASTTDFRAHLNQSPGAEPNTKPGLICVMTLEQACPSEYQRAQCAFKDSMIH